MPRTKNQALAQGAGAKENRSWGYDRIADALAELGYEISDQTVGNILKRRGLPTAPDRQKINTWKDFIRSHMEVLWATDFFSTEVWTMGGLVTFYVLFFIKLDTREVTPFYDQNPTGIHFVDRPAKREPPPLTLKCRRSIFYTHDTGIKKETLMKNSFIALIAGLTLLAGVGCVHRSLQSASFGPIDLPGTGDSQDLLRAIAEQYTNEYPNRTVTIPDSISSSGGIKVVGIGQTTIGRVARLPLPQEIAKYGEFNYVEFARVPVVFAVSRDAGVSNLSQQQLCDIYSGRITNWQDFGGHNVPIKAQARPEKGSNMILIRKEISCFTDLKITPNANANYRNFHMIESMQALAGAVGFMPLSEAQLNRLNVVTLDSVAPLSPQYKLGIGLGFVHQKPLSLSIQAFLDYLHTEPARAVIRQMGNIPVERTLSTQTH